MGKLYFLTTYKNIGGVLSLIVKNGEAVYNKDEKCSFFENVFFGGGHLSNVNLTKN